MMNHPPDNPLVFPKLVKRGWDNIVAQSLDFHGNWKWRTNYQASIDFLYFRVLLDSGDIGGQLESMKSPSDFAEAGNEEDWLPYFQTEHLQSYPYVIEFCKSGVKEYIYVFSNLIAMNTWVKNPILQVIINL